jgi:murein L,D-transpeptidase YafK
MATKQSGTGSRRRRARAVLLAMTALGLLANVAESRTIESVVRQYGPAAHASLRPAFKAAGVAYPPKQLWLVALKEEERVELWAADGGPRRHVKDYKVQAASGEAGPKLRQGDLQVPEGTYRILWLNPASSYHLSMKVDYPNAFDREKAARDQRTNLGGDIFIHGRDVSIGCIALGDPAIEELFVLVHAVGVGNVRAVIAPYDFRRKPAPEHPRGPSWLPELYAALSKELALFR